MSDKSPLRVLFMPSTLGNPYLELMANALGARGVEVRMTRSARHVFPFLQAVMRGGPLPHIFHLHHTYPYLYWPRTGRLSRLLALRLLLELRLIRRAGIPIVWTLHNMAAHESQNPDLERRVSRRIAALCERILVHCEAARQSALAELGPETESKLVIVPHGRYSDAYPDELSREDARAQLGLSASAKVFLMFGRMRRYKGTPELLEAFAQLADPDARLVLAGKCRTPEIKQELEALTAGNERVLTHLEYVPDDDIQRFMRAADVMVLPFRDILTSGSAVLAMSFGLPVIAPTLGCIPELLEGQDQLLYDADDPDGLARTLQRALSEDLRALGEANKRAIEAVHWPGVAERMIRLAYRPATTG